MSTTTPQLETLCQSLRAATPPSKAWQWDGQFNTALLVVLRAEAGAVQAVLDNDFSEHWGTASIAQAPPRAQRIAGGMRGLSAGQALHTVADADGTILFAAWWPWGNGSTVSLRVGCDLSAGPDASGAQPAASLKQWFGL